MASRTLSFTACAISCDRNTVICGSTSTCMSAKNCQPILRTWHFSTFATPGTAILVQTARETAPIAFLPEINYYDILAEKLKWRGL